MSSQSQKPTHEWARGILQAELPHEDAADLLALEAVVGDDGAPVAFVFCKAGGAFEKERLFRVAVPQAPGEKPEVQELTLAPGDGIMEA